MSSVRLLEPQISAADPSEQSPISPRWARGAAFALALLLVTYYALRGGSYDVVVGAGEAIGVWLIVAVGAAVGLLPRGKFPRGAALPLGAIALLAIWTGVSLAWSGNAERTVMELMRVVHYTGVVVLVWALVDHQTWSAAVAGLATAGFLVCGIAMASRLGVFAESDVARLLRTKRLDAPLNHWNAVAGWAGMCVAIALAYSAHQRQWLARAVCLAVVPLCGAVAYLTYSRGGAVGVAAGVLAVIALSRNRWVAGVHVLAAGLATAAVIAQIRAKGQIAEGLGSAGAGKVAGVLLLASVACALIALLTLAAGGDARWRLPRREGRWAAAVAALLSVVALAVVGAVYGGKLWHDFRDTGASTHSFDPRVELTAPRASRYLHWRTAVQTFGDHPVLGTGAGTSVFWLNEHLPSADTHTLSDYFQQVAELGVPGLALTVAFLGGLLATAARARRSVPGIVMGAHAGALAAFFVFLVDAGLDGMWHYTAVTVFALAACALAAVPSANRGLPRFRARLAIVAVALVACVVQLPGLVSTVRVRDSQEAFRHGDTRGALADATDAVAAEPWASSPYVQRALVAESAGALDRARQDLLRAIDRGPKDYRYQLLLARVEAERGRTDSSTRAFSRARRLRPVGAFTVAP